ncbi:hypothetical protein J3R30DRAFT_3712047 [Lentinula aciculospora]|uniref:Uncharacterized protein n=1 Tax=Lentinula aciculospora TaxID=153920 RepID=A0A9W8ZYI8_9AGAR|nr:hypothetical protein J3R30DRAFT_3712047 [Lentinula aciculospora]
MASCEVHQCFIRRRSTCEDDPDFLSLKELPEDEVLHTVQYTFVDLRLSAPSTSSVEPTELWTSPMEEASTKPPSTGSVSRASDALGLDAPVVLSKAELVGDGRAHFPVEEESYFDSRGFYILPSSPSVSRCSSNGMTGSPIQSTCGIYDASKNTMYKSDFRSPSSASVNNMPSSTCTSTYSITASTPQYNYLTTFSPTEWMEHQAYHQQQLAVLSSPDDKRYAYFWEQPTSHDQSCYSGYVTPMNYTPMIPETQEPEPQNLYVYAQPEYMTTSPVPAYSDNLCQRQHDHQMCDTYIYENLIDFPGCSSLKSKIAYASEPTLTSSNLSPQLSYCAIEDGYQMCSPAQICD